MYPLCSGIYDIDGIGRVNICVRANARCVRARWKKGMIHVSAPPNITLARLRGILQDFMPRLSQLEPEPPYRLGQTVEFPDFTVEITGQHHAPDKIVASFRDGVNGSIGVGSDWDMRSADTMRAIDRFICRMAQSVAPGLLLPRARELARAVGRKPLSWTISNGHRTLGRCSAQGVIALSYALVFYPRHLRDYVIMHELAHLTELNHSAAFHATCDAYCGGREREYEAELKAYRVPMLR